MKASRRNFIMAGSLWLTGLFFRSIDHTQASLAPADILLKSDPEGGRVAFEPRGLLVRPGQRIRWINTGHNVHTATAYHPVNDQRPLRIPRAAAPWNSGYLLKAGDLFEVTLTVEGIYDYYCRPHEAAGMVGRIIVARTGNLGSTGFRLYPDDPGNALWKKVPVAALRQFPSPAAILRGGFFK